ncbi:dockerin type I repeat-containing protein [Ruminococcus sp.]|uniref:dockerin type I repeat-containing protein n=1 Tax=Ruminococcus sp. TaxID=41978 RepID=UPI00344FB1B6
MKKIISILLTASMLAGSAATPFTAIAAETATTASQASEAEKSTMTTDINSTIKDLGVFEEGEKMTLDDVIALSKKGNALTLNDFSKFKGVIAGSGIFILEYDLGKGYTLMVGSVALDKIDYARLRYSDSENYVDIRTDDVETFLKETSGDTNGNTNKVKATVLDINGKSLLLQSVSNCSERYLLSIEQIKGDITPTVGMSLEITYDGGMFNLVPILLIGNVKKVSVVSEKTECLKGDANCDGGVDMADAVLIMQALANPNKYGEFSTEYNYLTAHGRLNGDMNGDGLTSGDALAIQRKLLGLEVTNSQENDNQQPVSVKYESFSHDYPYYNTVSDLANKANQVFSGKVTNISFEMLDLTTMQPVKADEDSQRAMICTIYEIEAEEVYAGTPTIVKLRIEGGIPSSFEQEQITLLGSDTIPVMEGTPVLEVGANYLFALYYADGSEYSSILNPLQSIYTENEVQTGGFSADEIISYYSSSNGTNAATRS